MTAFEKRLQFALGELADQAGPPPIDRWVSAPTASSHPWRAPLAAAAVVVITVTLLAAGLALLRQHHPTIVEPARRPPHVVGLAGQADASPGASTIALTLGRAGGIVPSAYVLPEGAATLARLPAEPLTPVSGYSRPQLALDGTTYIAQHETGPGYHPDRAPAFFLVDLRTGTRDRLGGATGFCPELSADGDRVAFISHQGLRVLNTATRTTTTLRREDLSADAASGCGGGLGWAPDGRHLAVSHATPGDTEYTTETMVLDMTGRVVATAPGQLANASMSWSPDSAQLLTYAPQTGQQLLTAVDSGATTQLNRPTDAVGTRGWAGARVVWLLGGAGNQRMVTTDAHGDHVRPWVRFAVGPSTIASVQWSDQLTGTAAR